MYEQNTIKDELLGCGIISLDGLTAGEKKITLINKEKPKE